MARTREIPCLFYINLGNCQKGRNAKHFGYCQRCDLYRPRAKQRKINKKKEKLKKIREKDLFF